MKNRALLLNARAKPGKISGAALLAGYNDEPVAN